MKSLILAASALQRLVHRETNRDMKHDLIPMRAAYHIIDVQFVSFQLEKCLLLKNIWEQFTQSLQIVVVLVILVLTILTSTHHMSSVHSLPVFGEEFQPLKIPSQSAFNGHLQTFVIEAEKNEENSLDLQTFMQSRRAQIEDHFSNQNTRLMKTTKN